MVERKHLAPTEPPVLKLHEIISKDVNLKKSGSSWKGLCPFHKEKTPSFHVYEKDRYYCFSCSAQGDSIEYLRKIHKMSFHEAKNYLGLGEDLPPPPLSIEEKKFIEVGLDVGGIFSRVMNLQAQKNQCRDDPTDDNKILWRRLNSDQRDIINNHLKPKLEMFDLLSRNKVISTQEMRALEKYSSVEAIPFLVQSEEYRKTLIFLMLDN